jgi:hypothetical protein
VSQSKHVVPTKQQNRPLIGTGMDRALASLVSNDFAFKARRDGVIKELDLKTGIAILQYDNGDSDVIDLTNKQSRNTGTGYWITNVLEMVEGYKVGSKFKANDVLAYNQNFFKFDNLRGGLQHTPGKLSRVAIASGPFTYEDSSLISATFSKAMQTDITMERTIDMPLTVNITKIVKKGDVIRAGDTLIAFEEASEQSTADFIRILGDDLGDSIAEFATNKITTKVTGEIVDMRVYYSKPLPELDPTLQRIVKQIQEPLEKYNKSLFKHFKPMPKSSKTDYDDETSLDDDDTTTPEPDTNVSLEEQWIFVNQDSLRLQEKLQRRGTQGEIDSTRKYSCVMSALPTEVRAEILNWISVNIDPNDILEIEEESHITILYGLEDISPPPEFETLCQNLAPCESYINELRSFDSPEREVLYMSITEGLGLSCLRSWLRYCMPHVITHPKYTPHITLCYLKPGAAAKYKELKFTLAGTKLSIDNMYWNNRMVDIPYQYQLTGGIREFPAVIDSNDIVTESILLENTKTVKKPVPDSVDIRYSGYVPRNVKIAKGNQMQGLRITFMIKFSHNVSIGDKVAYYAALKSVVADVLDEGEEPYYVNRFGEKVPVDAVTSPFGVLNRKTQDIPAAMAMGMLLVEMKRDISNIATKHGLTHEFKSL